MTDASTTWPGRILYMYSPTNSAIGMVQAIVNVPHGLPGIARTPSLGKVVVKALGGEDVKYAGARFVIPPELTPESLNFVYDHWEWGPGHKKVYFFNIIKGWKIEYAPGQSSEVEERFQLR